MISNIRLTRINKPNKIKQRPNKLTNDNSKVFYLKNNYNTKFSTKVNIKNLIHNIFFQIEYSCIYKKEK